MIQIDTREKAKIIAPILAYFDEKNIPYITSKLYVGDYMSYDNPRLVIDRKHNLQEICANLSDVPKKDEKGQIKRDSNGRVMSERARFIAELKRAKQAGIKVIVLCEHGRGIKTLEDVKKWQNPRLKESPLAMSGERLYKLMSVIESSPDYDVKFRFCTRARTGEFISKILK